MSHFTEEWRRVDLPVLARQGMQCSARLALEAIEEERAHVFALASALRTLIGHSESYRALTDLHRWHRRNLGRTALEPPPMLEVAREPMQLPLTGHAALDTVRRAAWELPETVRTEIDSTGEVRAHALDLLEQVANYSATGARSAWSSIGQRLGTKRNPPMLSLREWWRLRAALPAARGGEERAAQAELAADAVTGASVAPSLVPVTGATMLRAMADALEAEASARLQCDDCHGTGREP